MPVFRKWILILCLPIIWPMQGYTQENRDPLRDVEIFDKFGQISHNDLNLDANHDHPYEFILKESAIRMVEDGRTISASIDYLIRIKVYSDEPLSIAEASLVGIPYYFADGIEQILHIEGVTHQPDDSRSFLSPDRLRMADLNSRYRMIEFEMPDVRQGSVIEYKYRLERRYIEELPDFYFSERVPVRRAVLHFENSDLVRYDVIKENADFEIEYEEVRVDTSSVPLIFTYRRPEPVLYQKWSAEEVPPVDASAFISSIDDVRGKLRFQISEFGAPRQPLENSWEFVTAQILRNNNPFDYIEQFPNLHELGREIASGLETLAAAQDSIFQLVNTRAEFNGQGAIFADSNLNQVLFREPANLAEINLTLFAILRGAGIDAKPVYYSSREFGRINPEFPSLYQFNRMLVVSRIDENFYFMDASYPFSLPDLIRVESYNDQGLVVSESGHEWLNIEPGLSRFGLDIRLNASLSGDGHLEGELVAEASGYPAREIRRDLSSGKPFEEIVADTFFDIYGDVEIGQSEITPDRFDRNKVRVRSRFRIPNYSITFSDGLEFRPMVVGYLFENPFQTTERRVPVTLDAPEKLSIQYRIELPNGFSFDVAGDTRSTSLNGASLFEEYLLDRNSIEYSFDIDIRRKEFPAKDFIQLRNIYERWVQLSNEPWFIEN